MTLQRTGTVEAWAGPATGLAGALVTGAGLVLTDIAGLDAVSPQASASTIAAAVAGSQRRLQIGSTVLLAGLFLLVWFQVHLPSRLDPRGAARWTASVASASGLIAVAMMALTAAYVRAAAQTSFQGADAVIPKAIAVFDWDYARVFAPFVAAHLLGAGLAAMRSPALPRWLGWSGVGLSSLTLAVPPGLMIIVYLLWLVVPSAALLLRRPPPARPAR